MQDFSYDPFDPAVMADPLPYYRTLRDEHPVYYVPKWDTYALSRFEDIWDVLALNDGTFVASEGTLPAATVLAHHNDGPVPIRRCTRCRFTRTSTRRSTRTSAVAFGSVAAEAGDQLADRIRELANERLDVLLAQGRFDLTQDYGGIVAASMVCELVGLPVELAPDVLATVNAGSLAKPGDGVDVANARPGLIWST